MTTRLPHRPVEATLHANNTRWTLHMDRDLTDDAAAVWAALTQPEQIVQWMPFRPDRPLTSPGEVELQQIDDGDVANPGDVLEVTRLSSLTYTWAGDELRWHLTASDSGTSLSLAHTFDDGESAASFAAGWHLCLGALELLLAGKDVPSVVGQNAMDHGWEELQRKYAELFEENDNLTPMDEL